MIYWIFDMDETLYRIPSGLKFSYNFINYDPELNILINNLPGIKILFTNGTREHTLNVLSRMKLLNIFHLVFDRNWLKTLKPDPIAFDKVIKNLGINMNNDTCFFFDDSIYNMMVSHNLGWNTIHIHPDYPKVIENPLKYIKIGFPNLKSSLIYYLQKIKSKKHLT
jgi:FMN phosphatase YigB (HAD superfamily)